MIALHLAASAALLTTFVSAHANPAFANAHGLLINHHHTAQRMQRRHAAKRGAADVAPWDRPLVAKRSSPSDVILSRAAGTVLAAGVVTAQPDNMAEGTATAEEGCTMWHTPVAGDVCSGIIAKSDGLDLADFYALNPSVSSDCKDLQIGLAYCIETDGSSDESDDGSDADPTCTSEGAPATVSINANVAVKGGAIALPTPSASSSPSPKKNPKPSPAASGNASSNSNADSNADGSGNSDDSSSDVSSIAGSLISGLIKVSDPGNCQTVGAQKDTTAEAGPNGRIEWLNCGISKDNPAGQWTPPKLSLSQVVVKSLTPGDIYYQTCSPEVISTFNQVGKEIGVPPIFLAAFAMQESTCQPNASGDNGHAYGLMQITSDKCGGAPNGNCNDIYYNVKTGGQYFKTLYDNNGNDLLQALGSYNGWFDKMSYNDATKAASGSCCVCQNNVDYLHQYLNAWCQGLDGGKFRFYNNLERCGGSQAGNSRLARRHWLQYANNTQQQ